MPAQETPPGTSKPEATFAEQHALDRIAHAMLWPKNLVARDQAHRTMLAVRVQELVKAGPSDLKESLAGDIERFVDLIAEAGREDTIRASATKPYLDGYLAGLVAYLMVNAYLSGTALTLSDAKEKARSVLGQFKAPNRPAPLSNATVNAIWGTYRPVAHLWATYVGGLIKGNAVRDIPCRFDGLAGFLLAAECLADLGSQIKLANGETLVRDDALRIPVPPGGSPLWIDVDVPRDDVEAD